MNWVGGARSRIKQQSEKKQQREYFERKRYQSKVQYRDRSEDKKQCGISQDLISFRTVEKAHSTPINRDACERRVKVVDIDGLASKDPLKSHRKSIYDGLNRNVELPSSPSKYPSLLQILGAGDYKENVPDYPTIKDKNKWPLFAMENKSEMPLKNKTRRKNSGINVLQTHSTAENCVDPFSPYTTPAPGTHKDKDTSRLGITSRPLKSLENTSTLNLQSKRNAPFISDNHFEIPAKRQIYATEDFQDSHKIKPSVLDSAKQKNVKFYSPIEQNLLINSENFSTSEVDQKPSIQDYDSHEMRKIEEQNKSCKEDITPYHRRLSELFGQRESNKVQTVFDEENQQKSRLVHGQHSKTSRKRKPSSRTWRLDEDTRVENKPAHSIRKPASVENAPNINND